MARRDRPGAPAGLPAEALEERTVKMARRGERMARKVKPASADPFAARAARWISGFDALIVPTLARQAVPIGTWAGKGWFPAALSVGNWLCATPWNLAGLPGHLRPGPGQRTAGRRPDRGTGGRRERDPVHRRRTGAPPAMAPARPPGSRPRTPVTATRVRHHEPG